MAEVPELRIVPVVVAEAVQSVWDADPVYLFEPLWGSIRKVRCIACGATGYDGDRWQDAHRRGHAPCPKCGKMLTVRLDGSPRTHTGCPGPQAADPDGQTCVVCGSVDADIEFGWSICALCFRIDDPVQDRPSPWVTAAHMAAVVLFLIAAVWLAVTLSQVGGQR
jgi:hypothetical protein